MVLNDYYEEKGVVAKPKPWKKVLMWVFAVLSVLSITATILTFNLIAFGVAVLTTVVYALLFSEQYIEYDYCFYNENVEIDKVMNRSRRKRAIKFSTSNIRMIAPENSIRISNQLQQYPNTRVTDYTSAEPKDPVYAFILDMQGVSAIIYLEPTQTMMDHMKKLVPDKFVKD